MKGTGNGNHGGTEGTEATEGEGTEGEAKGGGRVLSGWRQGIGGGGYRTLRRMPSLSVGTQKLINRPTRHPLSLR